MSFANLGTSFIILIDVDGTKKIVRDVVVGSFSELKRVIGRNVPLQPSALEDDAEICYFDDRTNQFAVLHEAAWGHITTRRHLEIRVTSKKRRMAEGHASGTLQQAAATGSAAAASVAASRASEANPSAVTASFHGSSPSDNAAARSDHAVALPGGGGASDRVPATAVVTSTLRARIIDAVRRITRPTHSATSSTALKKESTTSITRQQLIELCSHAVRKYAVEHNVSEADLDNQVPSTHDGGVDYPWLEHYVTGKLAALRAPEASGATDAAPGNSSFRQPPFSSIAVAAAAPSLASVPAKAAQPELLLVSTSGGNHSAAVVSAPPADTVALRPSSSSWQAEPTPVVDRPPHLSAATPGPSRPTHAAALSPPAKPGVLLGERHQMPEVPAHDTETSAVPPHPQRPKDDSVGFYDNPAATALAQNRRSSKASSTMSTALPAAAASTFRAILYSVSGAVPAVPQLPDEQTPTLRVSLMCPRVWSPDEDVLITAHILTRTSVVLTLWLAYGPSRITLDLDDMYQRQCITTFQVSETGLLITIRRGTLVPGWEYLLHLRASSEVTGSSAASQVVFRVERHAAVAGGFKEIVHSSQEMSRFSATPVTGENGGIASSPWSAFVTPSLRGVTAQQVHHLPGYQADEDPADGTIASPSKAQPRETPPSALGSGGGSNINPRQRLLFGTGGGGAAGGGGSAAVGSLSANDSASRIISSPGALKADAASLPLVQPIYSSSATTPSRTLWTTSTPPSNAATGSQALLHSVQRSGRTYQEQLQRFLRDEIYPLIQLCSRPNVSQDDFDSIIARVAQMYGNARAQDENLDVALQREIVSRVKDEVVRLVQVGRGTTDSAIHRFTSTDIPSVGLRPQYATPVRR